MLTFIRKTFSVLDESARRRFTFFAVASVGIAGLEAIGVFLLLPMTQVLLQDDDVPLSSVARRAGSLFGADTRLAVAGVLAALVLAAFLLKAVLSVLLLRWSIGNSLREEARIAGRLFSHYLRAPYAYHLNRNTAELQRTLNESLLLVFRRTVPFVLAATADIMSLVGIALIIVVSDPAVAGIGTAYFLLVGITYQRLVGGRQRVAAKQSHEEIARRYRDVQEALYAVKDLHVLHRQQFFVDQFVATKMELMSAQRLLVFFQLAPRYFLDVTFLIGAGVVAGFTFATRDVVDALASVGLFLGASFRLVPPLNRVLASQTLSRTAMPGIDQVIKDLHEVDAVAPVDDVEVPPLTNVAIELEGVSFEYESSEAQVLREISLRIEPGDDVGFVGTSGAGKTTLVDVMLGLLDPTAGDVLLNGVSISSCRSAWQRSIGYVPQEIVLIDASIRQNIAFGLAPAQIDDERLWRALELSQLDTFIKSLPGALDHEIGERGVRLSGGQRQRIGLARALYTAPSVLVLDEATSSLDSETESRIIDTVERLHGSLTIVSVAHRLSTLKHCDRIYFLDRGRLAAVGTFDELRSTVPEFANLLRLAEMGK